MKNDPILVKAALYAKKKDYENAFKILNAQEEHYYRSFNYYYLYALICLHSGGHIDALANFRHASQIKTKDTDTMLGLAVLYLKNLNTVQAVDLYLDVLELDPKNKIAKKGLGILNKYSDTNTLSQWVTNPEMLIKLYPPILVPFFTKKKILSSLLIFFIAALLSIIVLINIKVISNPFKKNNVRPSSDFTLTANERKMSVENQAGVYRYILTTDQVISLYDKAVSLFTSYRDETAKTYINRITESNASEAVKNKAALLLNYMPVPGFDTFKKSDNFTLAEIKSEPAVYRDVYVIWKGMVTNVIISEEGTRFDFLVGYDTRKTLEGIVPVIFNDPVSIDNEKPLEILGKIALYGQSMEIGLIGTAIYQSGKLE